jgi:hypothetical protein
VVKKFYHGERRGTQRKKYSVHLCVSVVKKNTTEDTEEHREKDSVPSVVKKKFTTENAEEHREKNTPCTSVNLG